MADIGPPVGKTIFGITVWVIPGWQQTCLAWGGPGDTVHQHRIIRDPVLASLGKDLGAVSGRCGTAGEAQAAAQAWWAAQKAAQATANSAWLDERMAGRGLTAALEARALDVFASVAADAGLTVEGGAQ